MATLEQAQQALQHMAQKTWHLSRCRSKVFLSTTFFGIVPFYLAGNMDELIIRILCDVSPQEVDAIYLFAETADNAHSTFSTVPSLLERYKGSHLLLAGSTPRCGYDGSAVWRRILRDMGITENRSTALSTEAFDNLNTLTEAEVLVDYAKDRGLESIVIVAPPFHLPRAFITTVSVTLRKLPTLRVYGQIGTPLPWQETVLHSQGVTRGTRRELISSEHERIVSYREKGDLVERELILEYLNERDGYSTATEVIRS